MQFDTEFGADFMHVVTTPEAEKSGVQFVGTLSRISRIVIQKMNDCFRQ